MDGVNGFSISDAFGGKGAFAGKTQGQLYAGGVINTISTQTGAETYNHGPGDVNPKPQLTFALYNAKVSGLTLNTTSGTFSYQQGHPGGVGTLVQFTGQLVPEPATLSLLALGGSAVVRRRRK